MNSYTKKRKIQELNESIEEKYFQEKNEKIVNEQLMNTLKAGVEGAAKNIASRAKNLFSGKQKIRKSPKLEGLFQKVKVRTEFLEKNLDFMTEELNQYYDELKVLKDKSPDYDNEIELVMSQVDTYKKLIEQVKKMGDTLQESNVTYFT